MPPEKLFSPLASLTQIFLYLCLVKRPKLQWLSGGRQTYIKGVESTSYLRLSESHKFKSIRTVRQCSMSMMVYCCIDDMHIVYTKRIDIQINLFLYTHSVGFGIACPRLEGNARALCTG